VVLVCLPHPLLHSQLVLQSLHLVFREHPVWSDIQDSRLIDLNCKSKRDTCQIRHKYDKDIHKCLKYVLSKSQLGDWFVLLQLCKNCNPYFYREFIKELAIELKSRPKKSKAINSKTSIENGFTSPLSTPYNSRSQDDANIISLLRDEDKAEVQV